MPWFPEFFSAVELARNETRAAGQADPVGQYFRALENGDAELLETAWPGAVVVNDPRAGEIRGHRRLRRFVRQNQAWLAERHAKTTTLAATWIGGRAVVELLVRLDGDDGQELQWPVAVVAESADDLSVAFRTYCSQWPVDGQQHLRPPILDSADIGTGDVVERYLQALQAGDAEAVAGTFAPDGYYREPTGPAPTHRGTAELRSFFSRQLGVGGVGLQNCAVTDDGVRCALEYNCVSWGGRPLPPQAGLAVHERGPDGLLAAVRVYDDVQRPVAMAVAEPGVVGGPNIAPVVPSYDT